MKSVLFYGKSHCLTCDMKRPIVEAVCRDYTIPFVYVSCDAPEGAAEAKALGFSTVPALLLLDDDVPTYRAYGNLINARALAHRLP